MKDRIKSLRKDLSLTQDKFGQSINLTQNYIAQVEMGRRELSDRSVSDICRVFNVSEKWLRTGEGEMYLEMGVEDELNAYLSKISDLSDDDPRRKVIMMMAKIPEQYWGTIREILDVIAEK